MAIMSHAATATETAGFGGDARQMVWQQLDRWIFVFMAAFILATVLVGFVPASLGKIAAVEAGQRAPFPPVLHVHAVLMGSWVLLLLAQASLVAGRRGAMPLVAEPLFQALDAAVEIVPVMSAEDLKKAFAKLAS
jgi:hypothetical protein